MSGRTLVTLMTPDPTVATAVTAALQSNGHVVSGPAVRDVRDLPAQLGRSPVPIVLIDLDPQPQQVLPQLERIIARFPTTRFVASFIGVEKGARALRRKETPRGAVVVDESGRTQGVLVEDAL